MSRSLSRPSRCWRCCSSAAPLRRLLRRRRTRRSIALTSTREKWRRPAPPDRCLGVDRRELKLDAAVTQPGEKPRLRVETILSGRQAEELVRKGIDLAPKKIDGTSPAQRATAQAEDGFEVFRRYSGPGGLKEEFQQAAAANRSIAKLVNIGKSVNGQDIVALKLSSNARILPDGVKPSVLYFGAQHAREWITPEMIRRLMHHFVDGYKSNTGRFASWSTTTSCGSSRSPTPTATTGRSSPASGCGARTCATTTATADHCVRRGRPEPELRHPLGLRQRGLVGRPDERDLPRHRTELRAGDQGARLTRRAGSASISWSTTTRPPSSSSTEPGGRSRRRHPTTSSTRRWPATTPNPPSPATTRTSRPSSTPPTARPTCT